MFTIHPSSAGKGWIVRLIGPLLLGLLLGTGVLAEDITPQRLKAALLFNFAKFTTWPTHAFADAQAPFHLCVFGDRPFPAELEILAENETVANRPVVIARTRELRWIPHCHLLFIAASPAQTRRALAVAKRYPVLTVGEGISFIALGGMFALYPEGDKIRIAANPRAMERAGVKVSANLLHIARILQPDGEK